VTRVSVAWLVISAALCSAARAQPVRRGEMVRLNAPGMRLRNLVARLLAVKRDTIVVGLIRTRSDAGSWRTDTLRFTVPTSDVSSLEVVRSRSHILAGAAIGGVGSAVATFLIVKAGEREHCGFMAFFCWAPGHATDDALTAGLVGAGVGALVGIATRSRGWKRVSLERLGGLSVALTPRPGRGIGLGISLPL
jgi:hypothetical protein